MDFLNETFDKAKDLFSVAKQKATDAVNVGKQKYDIASLENKTYKLYAKLGQALYPEVELNDNTSAEVKAIILQIRENKELIAKEKAEIDKIKHKRQCATCGASVEEEAKFCNNCGAKLFFEE